MGFDVSQVPSNVEEVDALIASVEGETPEEVAPEAVAPEAKTEEAPQPTAAEIKKYELVRRGLKRQMTAEEMIPLAQQGWDYTEKMREFNEQRAGLISQEKAKWEAEFNPKIKDLESKLTQYKAVDDYIKQDPAWWDFVQSQYQNKLREQGGQAAPQNHPVIEELKNTVQSLVKDREAEAEKARLVQEAEKDQKLEASVREYMDEFPDFDWKTTNNEGLTLEHQILQHAIDQKIGSFRAAANDFLFKEHLKRHETRVKEDTGKELKKQAKLGLGPVTDKPTMKVERAKNVRGKSYDDLVAEALDEIG